MRAEAKAAPAGTTMAKAAIAAVVMMRLNLGFRRVGHGEILLNTVLKIAACRGIDV